MRILLLCILMSVLSTSIGCSRGSPAKEETKAPTAEELDKINTNLPPGQSIAR